MTLHSQVYRPCLTDENCPGTLSLLLEVRMHMNVILIALSAAVLTACGPNCESACYRLYGQGGECQIDYAGSGDEYSSCIATCEGALSTPGELNGYDPNVPDNSGDPVKVENDQQAALWMECVAGEQPFACQKIEEENYCPGI